MRTVTTNENTYGFEIEFCTHDNTILRYTHIEIAEVILVGDAFEIGNTIPLKLETDSGDVLELVTPPIIFNNPQQAAKFRNDLAEYLKGTVRQPISFGQWWDHWVPGIIELMNIKYSIMMNPGSPQVNKWILLPEKKGWELNSFNKIVPNISINNIDDGINIAAASKRRHRINGQQDSEKAWQTELGQTILCESTKDWPTGYSTQTSIPMRAHEYVQYVLGYKLLKSNANLRRLENLLRYNMNGQVTEINETLQWDKVERWATTWFWGGVTFDLFLGFLGNSSKVFDNYKLYTHFEHGDGLKWSEKLGKCDNSIPNLPLLDNWIAAMFIVAQKTLTGTLGGLSERRQLEKQKMAHEKRNAAAMEQRDYVQQPTDGKYYWCEYHSSLKDILGVWFKGHLADVLKELLPLGNWALLQPNEQRLTEIYTNRLKEVKKQLEKFKRMPSLPEFIFIPDDKMLPDLVKSHLFVINKTDEFIRNRNAWDSVERKQKFLEYSSGDTFWEGRKDTMISPIKHEDAQNPGKNQTFFLVEHRNN
jgi:hypothetical protein